LLRASEVKRKRKKKKETECPRYERWRKRDGRKKHTWPQGDLNG
jgi:hypothetical protein